MMATITVTIPDELLNLSASLEKAAINAVNTTVRAVHADFESSVTHFVHKPAFHEELAKVQGDIVRGSVWTDDENYVRLSNGTTAHDVGAGRLMRFLGYGRTLYGTKANPKMKGVRVYKPKSIPGQIRSVPGFPMPGTQPIVRRGPWNVRGIEPRNYDQLIADKNQPVLDEALRRELKVK